MGMDEIYGNNIGTNRQNIWDRLKEHHVRDTWELQDQHQKHLAKTCGISRNTFERNNQLWCIIEHPFRIFA